MTPQPQGRPEDCSCCWIMGFGLHDDDPEIWGEEIFSLDEECPDHGEQARTGSSHSVAAT